VVKIADYTRREGDRCPLQRPGGKLVLLLG
jgi:hypothetical protein